MPRLHPAGLARQRLVVTWLLQQRLGDSAPSGWLLFPRPEWDYRFDRPPDRNLHQNRLLGAAPFGPGHVPAPQSGAAS